MIASRFKRFIVVIAGAVIASTSPTRAQAIAGSADLLSASIEQHPPFHADRVGDRGVTIRFVVAARPTCEVSAGLRPSYLILADSFPWRNDHVDVPGFPELKFQSAITIRCEGAEPTLRSNVRGTIAVETAASAGAYAINLRTTVNQLPSLEFRWVAVATAGDSYTRAPSSGKYVRWVIHERTEAGR